MSKGNLLFGQARGKVGDLVLTRLAGEQVARARNRAPKNPRTIKQMVQRAMMATLVEFYTRGTRNLFKFAFESKKPGESDYNAFVRANMGKVPMQSKKTIATDGFIGGEYTMSQGSLPGIPVVWNEDIQQGGIDVGVRVSGLSTMTIGKVSQLIIDAYGLNDGDIITFVNISAGSGEIASDISDAIAHGELVTDAQLIKWVISQFTLDTTSTAPISGLSIFGSAESEVEPFVVPLSTFADYDGGLPAMAAIIVSRNEGSKVKVSTSVARCSGALEENNAIGMSDEWKTYVAKHYMESSTFDAKPEDILKGSISKN